MVQISDIYVSLGLRDLRQKCTGIPHAIVFSMAFMISEKNIYTQEESTVKMSPIVDT